MNQLTHTVCVLDETTIDGVISELSSSDLNQRQTRSLIFHLLYAADAFEYTESLETLIARFNAGYKLHIIAGDPVETTTRAVIDQRDQLDEMIKPLLHNWRFDRIGMSTKLILRLALWELQQRTLDHKIVINEAIELAKCFAEDDAFKFVNGLLDEAIKLDPTLFCESENQQASS